MNCSLKIIWAFRTGRPLAQYRRNAETTAAYMCICEYADMRDVDVLTIPSPDVPIVIVILI